MPEVMITGPAGRLEARYEPGTGVNPPIALILHPHPQHGGTMNSKIVYSLFHIYRERGFAVMRFNFRGVGKSAGTFDKQGDGELSDAASALDWLQAQNPNASAAWVGGFSFGAYIGMELLMRRPEINRFTVVAPPVSMFDFGFLAPCPSSGLIIQGERDDIVPKEAVDKLVKKLRSQRGIQIEYCVVPGADHFFETERPKLMLAVDEYIDKHLHRSRPATAAE